MASSATVSKGNEESLYLWSGKRLDQLTNWVHTAQCHPRQTVYHLKTTQEVGKEYLKNDIPTEGGLCERDKTVRNLIPGSEPEVLDKLQVEWDSKYNEWDEAGMNGKFNDLVDRILDRTFQTGIRPAILVFLGGGSLHDQNFWPGSFFQHFFFERIVNLVRNKLLPDHNIRLFFDDIAYTDTDTKFLVDKFSRSVGPEEKKEFTSCVWAYNWCWSIRPEEDNTVLWEYILYVTGRSKNPYRQICAQLMLSRIASDKLYPRAVICAPPTHDVTDEKDRNFSSEDVENWLGHYPEVLEDVDCGNKHIGKLCLYTRPREYSPYRSDDRGSS